MIRSDRYLAAAKVEEIARQMTSLGYRVIVEPPGEDSAFDLLAVRGDQTIAFDVKAQASLKDAVSQTVEARRIAQRKGYEFRLVIATPPHAPKIEIDGLEEALAAYLADGPPDSLTTLPPHFAGVDGVCDLEYDSVIVSKEGIEVRGSGLVEVTLEHDGGDRRDGLTIHEGFPFRFDVLLAPDMSLKSVSELDVDTSSFYG